MIKRQRGRGRNPGQKPQNNNPNRAYESNGPDLKVRGSAQTVFEKYQQLGRDCQSNGDRVLGENYMQHAEHYFRVIRAMQPTFVPRTELMIAGYEDEDYEVDENGTSGDVGEGEAIEAQNNGAQPEFQQNRAPRDNRERDNRDRDNRDRDGRNNDNRDNNRERAPREFRDNRDNREPREPRENREPRDTNEPRLEGDEGRYNRRRRRPDRPDRPLTDRASSERAPVEGGAHVDSNQNGPTAQQQDNRYEGRRDAPSDTTRENHVAPNLTAPAETSPSFSPPEFAQPSNFSDPQEIRAATEEVPVRERRPRPPRAPRAPRVPRETVSDENETGFGNELPAFLATPIPVVSGD